VWWNPRLRQTGIVAVGLIPLPRDEGIGLIPVRPGALDDRQTFDASLRALAESQPAIAAVLGERPAAENLNLVYPHWGHAEKYGVAGAVLVGDAAHPVTPAGGQGANMAVADAVALAELAQGNDDDLLERIERRRRPANERSVSISRRATQALSLPDWALDRLVPWGVRWFNRSPRRVARFIRRIATAFEDDG
jgi:2-polyprenyl-6-methoxyphenol hydroxylase-like FAD-dependent oxidoreductase